MISFNRAAEDGFQFVILFGLFGWKHSVSTVEFICVRADGLFRTDALPTAEIRSCSGSCAEVASQHVSSV